MMEKELVGMFEAAKKAAEAAAVDGASSNGPEVARCIDALKQLKSFPVTKDALVSTQVGRHLRHLTKHPQEKIQTMATDLLEVWKKVVIDETLRIKKSASFDNKSSTVKTEVSKATSAKVEKVSNNETVKIEKTITETVKVERKGVDTVRAEKRARDETVKAEKIPKEEKQSSSTKKPSQAPTTPKLTSMVKCNDAVRDKLREIISEALSKVASEVTDESLMDDVKACDPIRVAVSVESVMYEKLGRSTGTQKFKYRSIMSNLKDQKNPDLNNINSEQFLNRISAMATASGAPATKSKKTPADKSKKTPAASAAAPSRKPSTHPPFLEMISDAIVTLKDRTGSSQYAITKFIEEKHKHLPASFRKLLLVHLKRLVVSGKLVKVKNSFKLPSARSAPATKSAAEKPKAKAVAAAKPKSKVVAKPKLKTADKPKAAPKPKAKAKTVKVAKVAAKMSPGKKAVKPAAKAKSLKKLKTVKSPVKKAKAKK